MRFLPNIFALFCAIVGIVGAAEPVRFDAAGRLEAGELRFAVDCWNGKQNFTQGTAKVYQVDGRKNAPDQWSYRGTVAIPDSAPGNLSGVLTKTGENTYTCEIDWSAAPASGRSFTLRASLPAAAFTGRTITADGKSLELPPEKDKVDFFAGENITRVEIPCADGVLVLKGRLSLRIHDYRPRPDSFSLLLGIPAAPADASARKLRLEIAFQPYRSVPVDLRSAVNMGFADEVASDGKGGWTDQGPENDLRMIPVGRQRWRGTDFDVIDPTKNGGKSCLVLRGADRYHLPDRASGEFGADGPRGRWFYLLHALAWGSRVPELGSVTLTYGDGTRTELKVRSGLDVGNWWSPTSRGNGEVVWTGENRSSYVGLYRSVWPIEDKPIARIDFHSAGNAVWMIVAASVGDHRPPRNAAQPHYIVSGRDWKPIDFAKDIEPGSILDFSRRLDAPAGKYGPVEIRGGRFVFRDRPDRPLRFYGTNLCSAAPYADKAWAERLAERMAQFGFNAVRLHHHDGGIGRKDRTTELNTDNVDQLDYLIFCLKRKGIYITTDLYVSRRLPKGEIPEYPEALTDISVYKALFWLLDSTFENWKTHSRNYLLHVNPYTGLAIKDDPALLSISLVNEGNIKSCWNANAFTRKLYEERFEAWRRERKLSGDGDRSERNRQFERFLTEIYETRYAQMVEFIRSLGVSCPLSDQNMGSTPKLSTMRRLYDYVDNHGYSSHPRFAIHSWQLPSLLTQDSAIGRSPLPWRLEVSRLFGKPFTVTEFDYAKPNRFRAEGPALIGAYAGLQGWDALFQFAYSHGRENYQRDDRAGGHFDLSTDVVKSLAQRIGVALFSDSGVPPAPEAFAVLLSNGDGLPFDVGYSAELSWLGLTARIGTVVAPDPAAAAAQLPPGCRAVFDIGMKFPGVPSAALPVFRVPAGKEKLPEELIAAGLLTSEQYDSAAGIFRSADGKLELNRKQETFRAVADGCEVLILPAGKKGRGEFLAADNRVGRAVFAAVSASSAPLAQADRILLLHLTDSQATKMKFASPAMEQLDNWGEPPFLAARGEAVLTLRPAAGRKYRLYAVNTAGKRLAEIPLTAAEDGSFTFPAGVFQPFGSVFAYELEAVR